MARTMKSIVWGNVARTVICEYMARATWDTASCDLYSYIWSYGVTGCKHPGFDISMPLNTPLYAARAGKVKRVRNDGIPGRMEVVILDALGHEHLYTHMNVRDVSVGQSVSRGQRIGVSGSMNGPHLHFEHRVPSNTTSSGWAFVNPEPVLTQAPATSPSPSPTPNPTPNTGINLAAVNSNYRNIGNTTLAVYKAEFSRVGSPLLPYADDLYNGGMGHTALMLAMMWMEQQYGRTSKLLRTEDCNPLGMRPWESDPRRSVSRPIIDWQTRAVVGSMMLPAHYKGAVRDTQNRYHARFNSFGDAATEWVYRMTNNAYKNGVYAGAKTLTQMINIYAPPGDIHPVTGASNNVSAYYSSVVTMLKRYAELQGNAPSPTTPTAPSPSAKFIIAMGHRNTDGGGARGEYAWTPSCARALRDAIKARGGQAWIIQEEDGNGDPNFFPGGLQAMARYANDPLSSRLGPFKAYISCHYNGGAGAGFHAIYPDAHSGEDVKANNPTSVQLCRAMVKHVKSSNTVGILSWTRDSPGVMSERESGVGAQGYRLGEMLGAYGMDSKGTARVIIEAGSIDSAREAAYINNPQWVRNVYAEKLTDALEEVFGKFKTTAPLPSGPPATPNKLAVGQKVEVTASTTIYSNPGLYPVGANLSAGDTGTVIGGPGYRDAITYYNISYTRTVSGTGGGGSAWVREDALKATSAAPAPDPGTPNPDPVPDPGIPAEDQGPQGLLYFPLDGVDIAERPVDGPVSLTVEEPAEYVPGPNVGSWASLTTPAGTNLETNPYFRTTVAPWTSLASGTIAHEPGTDHPDGSGAKHTRTVAVGTTGIERIGSGARLPATASTRYTFSAWIRHDGIAARSYVLTISWRRADGTAISGTTKTVSVPAGREATRHFITAVAPALTTSAELRITSASGIIGDTFWAHRVMWEALAYAGPMTPALQPESRNILQNGQFDSTSFTFEPGWDVDFNNRHEMAPWGTWNAGVPDAAHGYHGAIDLTGGIDGSPCLLLRDRNSVIEQPHRWMAAWQAIPIAWMKRVGVGGQITFSAEVKVTEGKALVAGILHTRAGEQLFGPIGLREMRPSVAGQFQRLSLTFTIDSGWDLTQPSTLYLYGEREANGDPALVEGDIWVDDAMLERGAVASAFSTATVEAIGLPMPGYAWSGAEHESASTRAHGRRSLEVGYLPPGLIDEGAVAIRIRTTDLRTGGDRYLWSIGTGASGANSVRVRWNAATGQFNLLFYHGTTNTASINMNMPASPPEWITVYAHWKRGFPGSLKIHENAIGTGSVNWDPPGTSGWGAGINIGSRVEGLDPLGEAVDQMIVFDRRLPTDKQALLPSTPFWWLTMASTVTEMPVLEPLEEGLPERDEAYTPPPPSAVVQGPEPFVVEGRHYASTVRLFRGTIHGDIIAPLDLVFSGPLVITHNDDAAIKRTVDFSADDVLDLHHDRQMEAYADTIIPVMTMSDNAGRTRAEQMGVYILTPFGGPESPTHGTSILHGNDLTWLLARTPILQGWTAPGNTEISAIVNDRLQSLGFSPSQIAVGVTGTKTPAGGVPFWPRTTWLAALNRLLQMANWYHLAMNRRGVLHSRPYTGSLAAASPVVHYDTRRGHWISSVVERDPDYSRFGNIAIAQRLPTARNEPLISYEAVNDNPGSRTSTQRLGPILIEPAIEGEFTTEAEAKAAAEAQLERGQSFYQRIRMTTGAELTAESNEVVALDIERAGNPIITGRWWRPSWTTTYNGASILTEHALNHVEVYT